MSRAGSSSDLVACSAGADLVAFCADADAKSGSTAACTRLGVGVWLAVPSAYVGRACCVASSPPPVAFCHRALVVASLAYHKCAARVYGVSTVPNSTLLCFIPFTFHTTTAFSTPFGFGTHTGGPAGAPPPLVPFTPLRLPHPGPLRRCLLLLFLYHPLCCLLPPPPFPVVCPLRFVAAFFFFGGLGGSRFTSSTSLELVVELELEEEEEGLAWRGRFRPRTRPSLFDSNLSRAGEAAGGLSSVLTATGARAALPAGVDVLPTYGCGGLPEVAHRRHARIPGIPCP